VRLENIKNQGLRAWLRSAGAELAARLAVENLTSAVSFLPTHA
jgi:hypothetical protein